MKVLEILGLTLLVVLLALAVVFYEGDIPRDVVDARYTSVDSQFADFGELGRIHYRDQGDRRALPVVLIHGFSASLHTFEPWVEALRDEFRVITLDMPAHGLTGETPSRDYGGEAMLETLDRLADMLGLERFVIGGNSMGGGIAWRYTLQHPEKVAGLVLIDAAGNPAWNERAPGDGAVTGFNLLDSAWFRIIAEVFDPYYLVSQGLNASFYNTAVVDDAMVMRYNDLILREGSRRAILDRASSYQVVEEPPEVLQAIQVPTLVMWGKEDALIPFAFASHFTDNIANTTTAYYDNVGHIPMEEVPQQSAEDLIQFLRTIPLN